ncbi:gamma-aminobutyric acid receptor subunit beta-1-like isoform X2 [Clytia hemisphaerica]|uniref:gamma-aminobutyric acid receptor subunit beta-1-like isoform X2 n=1 Tax=Clytia hemisphaerica TaxID=252671 RepID=UPI0034D41373
MVVFGSELLRGSQVTYIMKRLLENYDRRIVPIEADRKPAEVYISVYITGMRQTEKSGMGYSFSCFFRMIWRDYRLKSENIQKEDFNISEPIRITMSHKFVERLWIPDVYLTEGDKVSLQDITQPNQMLWLYPNGTVLLSQRLYVELAKCQMNLERFPFDKQTCDFGFESYSYSEDLVKLHWWKRNGKVAIDYERVDREFLEYDFQIDNAYRISKYYAGFGNHTRCYMTFSMKRVVSYYLWQMYIPCILIVVLSWVSFWIDYRSTPARVGLGITTVLTMATLGNSIRSSLPKVNYSKSIDWYVLICFIYVFFALVEFALVGITDKKWNLIFKNEDKIISDKKRTRRRHNFSISSTTHAENESNTTTARSRHPSTLSNKKETNPTLNAVVLQELQDVYDKALKQRTGIKQIKKRMAMNAGRRIMQEQSLYENIHVIDKYARFVFPISFIIYNAAYFCYLIYVN